MFDLNMWNVSIKNIPAFLVVCSMLFVASPAWASGAQVPEASNLLIFALGVFGVVIGRRLSRRPKQKDPHDDKPDE
ncbi:hypothetical protein GRI39_11535 [Altererythrobacter indicus]|uniref:PEP-CTERM sorting domain-containing protein n=1 Tax=Altericroceibacterium indicum TaxID=374177 RepID=A0A845AHT1_9SPHN|nr:PEP-CTERM sorting domain-containing protein [Altericroceibacterium indicum]MXP26668.1 hypothetical protein [Altericroceibacterium indicum]